jgi:hypothetical protein
LDRDEWRKWYAARGLATVPVVPRGKRPLRAGWQRADAGAWDGAPPDANLGVVCGAPSGGLVVLDFDTVDGVHDAMGMRPEALAVHTVVVRTRRGWHVYAREPDRRTSSPWRGLDVRAEGSLVVAPPSVHPSGVSYEILRPDVGIAALASLPIELEARAPARPAEIDWDAAEDWVALPAPKLRGSWRVLRAGAPDDFDRSRADFAVARCFFERGDSVDEIAAILLALPGSKARERGAEYALRTATRAASLGARLSRGRG